MKQLIKDDLGVKMWKIGSYSKDVEEVHFYVEAPLLTSESWSFWNEKEAKDKHAELVDWAHSQTT